MSAERTVAINHRPPNLRGKYGITITPLDQGFANVTEIGSDQELTALLLDLEYSQAETDDIMRELEPVGAKLKHQRSFDPSKLKAHKFTMESTRELLEKNT
jgi:hypothetical protein